MNKDESNSPASEERRRAVAALFARGLSRMNKQLDSAKPKPFEAKNAEPVKVAPATGGDQ
ncbi:hypothetical protein [Crateriforma conspicua]|uniref:Uncharacterized protein n=1 Tax=Crateriforma conspicua TaxID=2527996 RepID=A0A5C5YAY4_9PLAN|nr:hypothetical protein [Crateriforma conspicua]TWT71561.1 hypothetical protein Pan14r_38710 [Crateriforma conspicua]